MVESQASKDFSQSIGNALCGSTSTQYKRDCASDLNSLSAAPVAVQGSKNEGASFILNFGNEAMSSWNFVSAREGGNNDGVDGSVRNSFLRNMFEPTLDFSANLEFKPKAVIRKSPTWSTAGNNGHNGSLDQGQFDSSIKLTGNVKDNAVSLDGLLPSFSNGSRCEYKKATFVDDLKFNKFSEIKDCFNVVDCYGYAQPLGAVDAKMRQVPVFNIGGYKDSSRCMLDERVAFDDPDAKDFGCDRLTPYNRCKELALIPAPGLSEKKINTPMNCPRAISSELSPFYDTQYVSNLKDGYDVMTWGSSTINSSPVEFITTRLTNGWAESIKGFSARRTATVDGLTPVQPPARMPSGSNVNVESVIRNYKEVDSIAYLSKPSKGIERAINGTKTYFGSISEGIQWQRTENQTVGADQRQFDDSRKNNLKFRNLKVDSDNAFMGAGEYTHRRGPHSGQRKDSSHFFDSKKVPLTGNFGLWEKVRFSNDDGAVEGGRMVASNAHGLFIFGGRRCQDGELLNTVRVCELGTSTDGSPTIQWRTLECKGEPPVPCSGFICTVICDCKASADIGYAKEKRDIKENSDEEVHFLPKSSFPCEDEHVVNCVNSSITEGKGIKGSFDNISEHGHKNCNLMEQYSDIRPIRNGIAECAIVVYGGRGGVNSECWEWIYMLRLDSFTWIKHKVFGLPRTFGYQTCPSALEGASWCYVPSERSIYVFGGVCRLDGASGNDSNSKVSDGMRNSARLWVFMSNLWCISLRDFRWELICGHSLQEYQPECKQHDACADRGIWGRDSIISTTLNGSSNNITEEKRAEEKPKNMKYMNAVLLNNHNIPVGRSWHSCVCYEDAIYIFGGSNTQEERHDMHKFCVKEKKWSEIMCTGDIPHVRYGHVSVVLGDFMYIYGGYGGKQSFLSDLYCFSFTRNEWINIPAFGSVPKARFLCMAAVHCGHLYIAEGKGGFRHQNQENDGATNLYGAASSMNEGEIQRISNSLHSVCFASKRSSVFTDAFRINILNLNVQNMDSLSINRPKHSLMGKIPSFQKFDRINFDELGVRGFEDLSMKDGKSINRQSVNVTPNVNFCAKMSTVPNSYNEFLPYNDANSRQIIDTLKGERYKLQQQVLRQQITHKHLSEKEHIVLLKQENKIQQADCVQHLMSRDQQIKQQQNEIDNLISKLDESQCMMRNFHSNAEERQ